MNTSKSELRIIIPLAIPVLISQVAQMSMGLVDTLMAARVGATDMAAVAVGSSIWMPVVLFGSGMLMVLAPIVANLRGAGKENRIFHYMNQSFWLTLLISAFVMIVLWQVDYLLNVISDDAVLVEKAAFYIRAVLWGAPAFLGFVALRSLNEGMSLTRTAMYVAVVGLLVNIPANYIFVYGKWGAPALGGAGCGVATALVYWVMFLGMLILTLLNKRHRRYRTLSIPHRFSLGTTWTVLRIGIPVAFTLLCEVGLFCVSALLIAGLGTMTLAAHQIAINVSSLIFMLPLSLGTAISIRVAHNLGNGNLYRVKQAIKAGFILGLCLALLSGVGTYLFRTQITECYTTDMTILGLAAPLLALCAIYQVSDMIQILGASILRGYKDTFSVMLITIVSYWVIAMPLAYGLGRTEFFGRSYGASGFWIGFIVGLTICAILLSFRIIWLRKKLGHRV